MPTDFTPRPPDRSVRMESMSAQLARNWWLIALRGVLAILFGILTFILPGVALATFIILFAAYMLVDGVFGIIAGVRAAQRGERWGLLILEGLVDIVIGVLAFLWPVSAVFALVIMIAAWAIVSGGLMIAAAFSLHQSHGRWLLAIAGLVSVLLGILLVVHPVAALAALIWWVAAYAIVFGIAMIALAFRLRGRHTAAPTTMAGSGI